MMEYDAYHITKECNVISIAKNGLIPNYGDNCSLVGDRVGRIFLQLQKMLIFGYKDLI